MKTIVTPLLALWSAIYMATLTHASGEDGWRALPLITDGKVASAWAQVGWGGFAVEDGTLRAEPDERGMGLLLYKAEKFGDCQLRIVYRCEKPKSNSGVYVRIDDGVLSRIGEKSPEVHRDSSGKLAPEMIDRLKEASEKHLGAWYPVHHGCRSAAAQAMVRTRPRDQTSDPRLHRPAKSRPG